jgi:hypothetical protein
MPDSAILVLQEGPGTDATRWPLDRDTVTIGRGPDNQVVLPDREVSRHHAQIRHEGGRYVLVDLGSKNGTLVNGSRIERATPLADGDEIRLAPRYCLLFVDSDATVPARGVRSIRVDEGTRAAYVDGRLVDPPLAPNQFALLQLLSREPGRVFTRDEIAAACYPEARGGVSDQAIDGVVRRLRARLAELDPGDERIEALRGHGFRLLP